MSCYFCKLLDYHDHLKALSWLGHFDHELSFSELGQYVFVLHDGNGDLDGYRRVIQRFSSYAPSNKVLSSLVEKKLENYFH